MPHRQLPRPGRRALTWLVSVALLAALTPVSTASGDHLGHRKQKVEREVAHADHELDQSTAALARAVRALKAAQARLARAQERLSHARAERVAAVLVDKRAQAELDLAEARLSQVEDQVVRAEERIGEREKELRLLAVQAYQGTDSSMMALSMVLRTDEPAELMGRLNSMDNVLERQASAVERLKAARIVLDVKRDQLQATRDLVADRRELAARTLEKRLVAEGRAAEAQQDVRELAEQARERKQRAAEARADDLARLRKLRKERAKVQRLLEKHYAAARRREAARRAAARPDPVQAANRFLWPTAGWVSSTFGMRLHPVYHRWTLHDGLDIAASCGRPIRAAARGRVVARYYNSAYGNRVVIGHGLRGGVSTATTYNHLRRFSTYVGEPVRRGEIIGFVGSTGYSTGCHLHFMVLRNGRPVNPAPWLG